MLRSIPSMQSLENALLSNANLVNETVSSIKRKTPLHSIERKLHVLFFSNDCRAGYQWITLKQLFEIIKDETLKFRLETSSDKTSAKKKEPVFGSIRFRDLRRLDIDCSYYEAPSIIQRRFVTIIVIPPIKAVIFCDMMIFVVPEGADQLIYILESHIRENEEYDSYVHNGESKTNESCPNFEVKSVSLLHRPKFYPWFYQIFVESYMKC